MNINHLTDDQQIAYALEEMPPADAPQVEEHLARCSACREHIGLLARAIGAVRTAPSPEPPARVLVDLLEAQAARRARRWPWPAFRNPGARPAIAAALVAALFLSGFWAGRRSIAPSPPPGAERPSPAHDIGRPLPPPPGIPFEVVPATGTT
jgi:anti-sigma factor RsiW